MSRRGENIYKRKDGRWEGRYIASYSSDGRAKYKSVYAHTYNEARAKMRNSVKLDKTCNINISVTDWTAGYLQRQRTKIKLSTMKVYERYLENHIKPFFGNTALRKLNKELLQTFVNSISRLSPSTVKGIFSLLREALKAAKKKDYIAPIWLDVELPKAKKHKVEVFTKEEQSLIEAALDTEENPNDVGILICLYTGLRIGEVCGLKWGDINFISNTLIVNRTVERMTIEGKSVLKELAPKSETSHRTIPIPSFLSDKLREIKAKSAAPYVLHTDFHIMDPRTFQYQYKKCLAEAGIRYLNFHSVRHTFATRCIHVGMDPKTLSEILGHSDLKITLDYYFHSSFEFKKDQMERLVSIS
ncbi:MAG: tyrosine-type recombinase/integrase [Hominilimicola sp.]